MPEADRENHLYMIVVRDAESYDEMLVLFAKDATCAMEAADILNGSTTEVEVYPPYLGSPVPAMYDSYIGGQSGTGERKGA
jgi:hypothetical protein